MTAKQIADKVNQTGYEYYGERARGWDADGFGRIYFGSDYITVESDGTMHNDKRGKARAKTIGQDAVDAVSQIMAA